MRPPDSGEPFLVNGIAYQHTLQLYLILESVMTRMGVVPTLLMSESFLLLLAAEGLRRLSRGEEGTYCTQG
jgi:hypothetical protein